jgi:DNA-binding response OmpR family regulator
MKVPPVRAGIPLIPTADRDERATIARPAGTMEMEMKSDKVRILIIDDEPNVRLVFRTSLETAGCYTVDEVDDGATALARLRKSPVDLVLLDLRMPGSGGMETLRRLRAAGDDVPVLIVTAHGSIPDAVAAMKLGAIDFLTKPIKPETLRSVVADVVRRRSGPGSGPEPVPAPGRRNRSTINTLAPAAVDPVAAKRALKRRDFDRARELLEEALELDPDSVEAHNLMGVLRECLGHDRAAYEAYRMALGCPERGVGGGSSTAPPGAGVDVPVLTLSRIRGRRV